MTDPDITAGQTWIVPHAPRIVVASVEGNIVTYHAEGNAGRTYARTLIDFTAWVVRSRATLAS